MNKPIITILIIIILVIGGFFLLRKKDTYPAKNQEYGATTTTANININGVPAPTGAKMETGTENETTFIVNYTDSGFFPKNLTIKKGDKITFVNQSSKDMWVASNPHPVHTDYPAFDEKAVVSRDGRWTFTFNKAGTWGYHNHKDPSSFGTVVVE